MDKYRDKDETGVVLGVFTDIQYRRDMDDYILPETDCLRSHRSALKKTESAVSAFLARKVPFVLHLGDIVDGRPMLADGESAVLEVVSELDEVLNAINRLLPAAEVCHVVGNHCLFVGRETLQSRLQLSKSTYYTKRLSSSWQLVVLDTLDNSVFYPSDHPKHINALSHLQEHAGEPNAVPWNGGLGSEQLSWLRRTLESARSNKVNVLVVGHHPFAEDAASAVSVAWDSSIIVDLFQEFVGTVRAYFAGHFHKGGYALVGNIHHITFPAVLDSDDTNSYAFVHLHTDKITIEGYGARGPPSRTCTF